MGKPAVAELSDTDECGLLFRILYLQTQGESKKVGDRLAANFARLRSTALLKRFQVRLKDIGWRRASCDVSNA